MQLQLQLQLQPATPPATAPLAPCLPRPRRAYAEATANCIRNKRATTAARETSTGISPLPVQVQVQMAATPAAQRYGKGDGVRAAAPRDGGLSSDSVRHVRHKF